MAPAAQRHVPALLWLGESYDDVDPGIVVGRRHDRFTHDHIFHTLLGFMEVETAVYRPELDVLRGAPE